MNRWLVALAALAVGVGACSGGDDRPSADELAASAVGVVASGCALTDQVGSGVVLGAPGQVVTVAHTLRGASGVVVVDAGGTEHAATVVGFDKDSDLAVLAAPTVAAAPLPVGDVELGAGHLLAWSRDGGAVAREIDVVKRLTITIEDIYIDEIVERTGLEIAGPVGVGDSGGPVVTTDGEVIGIVYAASRERDAIGFATDAAEVRAVLAERSDEPVPTGRCV